MLDAASERINGLVERLGASRWRDAAGRAAPLAAWLAAVLAVLLLPPLLYGDFTARIERLNDRITRAATAELAPLMPRRGVADGLAAETAALLERDELGLNYLTLRDAGGTVLLSDGRFEDLGESLSSPWARSLRGWLYRFSSDDRSVRLLWRDEPVGRMDYGVDLRRAVAGQPWWFWLLSLLWLAALSAALLLFTPARAVWARLREPPELELESVVPVEPAAAHEPGSRPDAAVRPADVDETQWQRFADSVGMGVVIADGLERVCWINDTAGELIGRPAAFLQGRPAGELADFTDEAGEKRVSPLQRCLAGEHGPLRDTLNANARRVNMIAARSGRNRVHALIWAAQGDRTDERTAMTEAFAGIALWAHGEEAAALIDGDGVIRDVNPALCRIVKRDRNELVGVPLAWLAPEAGLALSSNGEAADGETALGEDDDVRAAYRLVAIEAQGTPVHLVTLRRLNDPSEDKDLLTGLAMRSELMAHLRRIWPRDDPATGYGLLVMEIVGLGQHNRSLGRDAVDALLVAFAGRLSAAVPDAEVVARLVGGEFGVLLRLSEDAEDVEVTARRIGEAFAEPVRSGELELSMPIDIGVAVAPDDADSPETLLERAETALSAVQTAGDRLPRRYAPDMAGMDADAGRAARLLRRALVRRELDLCLRPVWRGAADAVVAAAFLEIAWDAPGDERYAGRELFAHAETLGVIGELAAWCLRTAAETYADWRDIGLTPVPLLVPLPAAGVEASVLEQVWRATERRYRLPASSVVLLPEGDTARIAAVGPRVARNGDSGTADVLCLNTTFLEAEPERAKAEAAAGHERGIPVIAGPVEGGAPPTVLEEAGIEYWYTDEAAISPRAFGRLIARRGAEPI